MENKTVKMYQQQSDLYGHDEGKSMSHFHENADTRSAAEVAEAQLLPCESEKKHILLMFNTMRKESFFCDVAFICHGVLFRAHRVVVSSWSRWLRALLCESPDEEVVALDFFEPDAFGAALDYMYGVPLIMNVEKADSLLKVVRRLEMQKLEQQCWRFLMTVIDADSNCEKLHELADRYDCPPLKLAAWRILQETVPGYGASSTTTRMLQNGIGKEGQAALQASVGATGLTGPGERWFNCISSSRVNHNTTNNRSANNNGGVGNKRSGATSYWDDEAEGMYTGGGNENMDPSNLPSVFDRIEDDNDEEKVADDDNENDDDDEDEEDNNNRDKTRDLYSKKNIKKNRNHKKRYLDPSELSPTARAEDVVKAWARRLKAVYDKCVATAAEAEEYQDNDFVLKNNGSTVRLLTKNTAAAQRRQQEIAASVYNSNNTPGRGQQQKQSHMHDDDADSSSSDMMMLSQSSPTSARSNGAANTPRRRPPAAQTTIANANDDSHNNINPFLPVKSNNNREYHHDTSGGSSTPMQHQQSNTAKTMMMAMMMPIDWVEELRQFYSSVKMPERSAGIPTILTTWEGREDQMVVSLLEKYSSVPVPSYMITHMEQLRMRLKESNSMGGGAATATLSPSSSPSARYNMDNKHNNNNANNTNLPYHSTNMNNNNHNNNSNNYYSSSTSTASSSPRSRHRAEL